jgi:cysteinyl-tRNA synthetase
MARYWLHVGMVSINGEKMSKSIGNIISVAEARRRWGANALRIYCISAHYSKPLDFSDTSIMVCLQKWRQVEVCAFELRFAEGESGKTEEIKRLCRESIDAFKSALEDDMNTALALSVFMKFINDINRFAADEELTKEMANVALIEFNNFLNILGLRVAEPTQEEIFQIESLLKERSSLRRECRFAESDEIRKLLSEKFSVRLIDHKARTIWMKIEDPH